MIKNEMRMPEWKAPETLFINVMAEVEKIEANRCFFSWKRIYQILFFGAVAISVVVVFFLSYGFNLNCNPLFFSALIYQEYSVLYNNVINVNHLIGGYLINLLKHPWYFLLLFVIGTMIIIAWTSSITALYRMLITPSGRKHL